MSRCDGFEDIYGVCLYISVMASKETFLSLRFVVVDDLLTSSAFRSFGTALSTFPFHDSPASSTMHVLSGTVQASVIDPMRSPELILPCIAASAVSPLFDFFSRSLSSVHRGHRLVLIKLCDHDS